MIQKKISKIDLKKFFYERHIEDIEYMYGEGKETMSYILIEYLLFNKMKKIF